jgi:hypothetical protein
MHIKTRRLYIKENKKGLYIKQNKKGLHIKVQEVCKW